jgi:SAM-dependent methyltransferase
MTELRSMRIQGPLKLTNSNLRHLTKYFLEPLFSWAFSLFPSNRRKQIAIWLFRQRQIPGSSWIALRCLEDLATNNIDEFHRFLWSNHLYYAESYEVPERFGPAKENRLRRLFFSQLETCLLEIDVDPEQIDSILEVGCSLGYQLQHMESRMFPNASKLYGIDIDEYAVNQGNAYLNSLGSKVNLIHGNMENLADLVGSDRFDVVVCTGVLMYLNEEPATAMVDSLLKHTNQILGIAGVAHPVTPNSKLEHSITRDWDQAFTHNIESMVGKAGGSLIKVSWEGDRIIDGNDGNTVYFVFAKTNP